MLYLKENYKEIFVEICNAYSEIMAKVYYLNFKTYSKTMNSLLVDIYSKEDLIYDAPAKIKLKNSIKVTKFDQTNRSIFFLGGRENILKNLSH